MHRHLTRQPIGSTLSIPRRRQIRHSPNCQWPHASAVLFLLLILVPLVVQVVAVIAVVAGAYDCVGLGLLVGVLSCTASLITQKEDEAFALSYHRKCLGPCTNTREKHPLVCP